MGKCLKNSSRFHHNASNALNFFESGHGFLPMPHVNIIFTLSLQILSQLANGIIMTHEVVPNKSADRSTVTYITSASVQHTCPLVDVVAKIIALSHF